MTHTIPHLLRQIASDISLSLIALFVAIGIGAIYEASNYEVETSAAAVSATIDLKILDGIIKSKTDSFLLIDARTPELYQQGHIPTALNLPLEQFSSLYPKLKQKLTQYKGIIIYCESAACPISSHLASKLEAQGHVTLIYTEGFREWKRANKPVITQP